MIRIARSFGYLILILQGTAMKSSGLSMKKKGVGSLVAKWQNIQHEVKRNK